MRCIRSVETRLSAVPNVQPSAASGTPLPSGHGSQNARGGIAAALEDFRVGERSHRNGEFADAFAGGGEDGVRNSGCDRGYAGFADAAGFWVLGTICTSTTGASSIRSMSY